MFHYICLTWNTHEPEKEIVNVQNRQVLGIFSYGTCKIGRSNSVKTLLCNCHALYVVTFFNLNILHKISKVTLMYFFQSYGWKVRSVKISFKKCKFYIIHTHIITYLKQELPFLYERGNASIMLVIYRCIVPQFHKIMSLLK